MSSEFILETRELTKEFKGFVAVNKVNLNVRRGSIHALIGPNGAGKTTCFNLLTKFLKPTSGQILFDGHDITSRAAGAHRAPRRDPLVPDLGRVPAPLGARERARRAAAQARHLVPLLALGALAAVAGRAARSNCCARSTWSPTRSTPAVELAYGRKRALEIATTLAMDPKLMLLDEPTQGMGLEDVDRIRLLIKKVAADRTVLMVEHNMSVVASIADTITVLQRGATLAEGPYEQVSKNPAVIEAYMGSAQVELKARAAH